MLVALVVAAVLAVAAFFVYAGDFYHDADAASDEPCVHRSAPRAAGRTATWRSATLRPRRGMVLYPGAKVEYTAYAPLMRELAERGYLAVVVEMPFNFAFFGINAADGCVRRFPR